MLSVALKYFEIDSFVVVATLLFILVLPEVLYQRASTATCRS